MDRVRALHRLYLRQLSLGEGIDSDRIAAAYENGVLTLTIPVAEKAKPRRIEVGHDAAGGQRVIEQAGAASSEPSTAT